jgi:hypothetical protein
MLQNILKWLFGLEPAVQRLKENSFPRDKDGRPDLSCYTEPVEYYVRMHEAYLSALRGPRLSKAEGELAWSRRANAQWGLIAKGTAAIPYARRMLPSTEPEAREDGAAILSVIGRDEAAVDAVLAALTVETDTTARDTLIGALGTMRSRKGISALAKIIADTACNYDTRCAAVESLGAIVGRRFHEQADPIQAASDWIMENETKNG